MAIGLSDWFFQKPQMKKHSILEFRVFLDWGEILLDVVFLVVPLFLLLKTGVWPLWYCMFEWYNFSFFMRALNIVGNFKDCRSWNGLSRFYNPRGKKSWIQYWVLCSIWYVGLYQSGFIRVTKLTESLYIIICIVFLFRCIIYYKYIKRIYLERDNIY